VLDNIQLRIIKLHFRVEDPEKHLSFGSILEELVFKTTDANWSQVFHERKKNESPFPIYKLLQMLNFSIYWNSKEDKLY